MNPMKEDIATPSELLYV